MLLLVKIAQRSRSLKLLLVSPMASARELPSLLVNAEGRLASCVPLLPSLQLWHRNLEAWELPGQATRKVGQWQLFPFSLVHLRPSSLVRNLMLLLACAPA